MQETNNIYQVRNCAINSGPAERSPGLFGENQPAQLESEEACIPRGGTDVLRQEVARSPNGVTN